jgi:hypothetical protein
MSWHNLALILLVVGLSMCLSQRAPSGPDTGIEALLQLVGIMPAQSISVDVSGRNAYISYDYPVNITPGEVSPTVVGPIGNPGLPSTPGTGGITGTSGISNASQANATAVNAILPSINVLDQAMVNDTVNIAEVESNGPGWAVIFNDTQGRPYMGIGYSPVNDGTSRNVTVRVSIRALTGTLHAALYRDMGQIGIFEYPGPDVQQMVNGQPVLMPFEVTNFGQTPPAIQPSAINQTLSQISRSPTAVL